MSEATHAYIGINKDGKCRAAVVDNPDHAKDTRKSVQEFMKSGLTIERVTIEEARKRLMEITS